jgi:CDGSH-type Zn-finger protein
MNRRIKILRTGMIIVLARCGESVRCPICAFRAWRVSFAGRFTAILESGVDHDAKLSAVGAGFGFTEGPVWGEAGFLYKPGAVAH